MACELALAAGVKQLALFHHDPNYDDETVAQIDAQARNSFPAAFAACEGLEVALPAVSQEPTWEAEALLLQN